jgi:CRP-like cAMP-binding protein
MDGIAGQDELRQTELFGAATPEILAQVLAGSATRTYSSRECLFRTGQPADRVFLVLEGQVQIYLRQGGKHAVLTIVGPGEACALHSVLDTGRHTGTAEAIGGCRVLEIPAPLFSRLVRDPAIASGVIHLLATRLQDLSDQVGRVQLMQTTQRLADYLLSLAPKGSGACEVELPYEKALIATYLGMEPESFSRAMKNLRPHGLSCDGRKVRLDDPKALRDFCMEGRP